MVFKSVKYQYSVILVIRALAVRLIRNGHHTPHSAKNHVKLDTRIGSYSG